jgi:hypothetical protein
MRVGYVAACAEPGSRPRHQVLSKGGPASWPPMPGSRPPGQWAAVHCAHGQGLPSRAAVIVAAQKHDDGE